MTDSAVAIIDTARANSALDDIAANIKLKLVENKLAGNIFKSVVNQNYFRIGMYLQEAKSKFKKSTDFYIWAEHNFNFKKSAVYNYIGVAERFQNFHARGKLFETFNFRQLVEMLVLPAGLENKFVDAQIAAGVDVATLSTRQLKAAISKFKNPVQEISTTTAPAIKEQEVLKLPPPSYNQIPNELIDAAESADLSISMQFGRGLELPDNEGVLITKDNYRAKYKFFSVADAVIFTPPIAFTRSDNAIKKKNTAIWYFGGLIENFYLHFSKFGVSPLPLKVKKPAEIGGLKIKGYDLK